MHGLWVPVLIGYLPRVFPRHETATHSGVRDPRRKKEADSGRWRVGLQDHQRGTPLAQEIGGEWGQVGSWCYNLVFPVISLIGSFFLAVGIVGDGQCRRHSIRDP
jgi:hypothetical protein